MLLAHAEASSPKTLLATRWLVSWRRASASKCSTSDYDDSGEVFGRPEQVELDVIVKNGTLIICESKSSIDKAGMYIFEHKARFYEKRHGRRADRLVVISPMIDPRAQKVADKLGIETYYDSSYVNA